MFMNNIDPPTPPEWWDPRPATVRYHRPGWRVFVFLLVIICGCVLIRTGRGLETVLLTLFGVGLAAATISRWVTDEGRLPSLTWLVRSGLIRSDGAE